MTPSPSPWEPAAPMRRLPPVDARSGALGLVAALFLATGCGPSVAVRDAPGAPDRRARRTGAPRADAARAQAWVIGSAEDLIGGPGATGQRGDVRIDNGRVAFVIEALDRRWGFALGGGNIVDADTSRGGRDALSHLFTYFGEFPRQAIYERLAIRSRRDGAAVVALEGRDSKLRELQVRTEYVLRPRVDHLELRTTIENRGTAEVELAVGDAIHWGGLRHFAPGHGFSLPGDPAVPWVAGVGPEGSLAYGVRAGRIDGPSGSSWTDSIVQRARIAPGARIRYERVLVVASTPDTAHVAGRIHELRGDPLGTIEGRLADRDGHPVAAARVEVRAVGGPLQTVIAVGRDGAFAARIPPGEYTIEATAPGRRGSTRERVTVAVDQTRSVGLELSRESRLRFRVRETGAGRAGDLVIGKLTIEGLEGTPSPDLGPAHRLLGHNVVYAATGQGSVPLAPGRYRVTVSRGPEYAISVHDVEIAEGAEAVVDATLTRVVDTRGYLCGDFHQHTVGSSDASTTIRDRIISSVGEGVEIVVATDHNVLTDFGPSIEALGLSREIFGVSGNEVTTDTSPIPIGHFNVFPLTPEAGAPRGGAWDVLSLTAAEVFALARADGPDRVVQINHPRSGDNGFFALAGYDPELNRGRPGVWASDFDAIEVLNGGRLDALAPVLTDVYAMWNRGLAPTITGSSDTHAIVGEEPGFPRTCLAVGDDPATLTVDTIVDALKYRRNALVTNGPFPRLRVEGADIGELVEARPGRVTAEIEVQAAPWVDVRTIQLVINGEPEDPIVLPPSDGPSPVVRWRGTLRPRLWRDSWLQLIVRGDRSLAPVVQHDPPDAALALTNPIWVDVDGNGRFDAPILIQGSPDGTGPSIPRARPRPPVPRLPRVNPADR